MNVANTIGSLTLTRSNGGKSCLLALHGEHDMSTTELLTRRTDELGPECTDLVVDLSATTFIDSSVIGWLFGHRGAQSVPAGRTLRIVAGRPGSPPARLIALLDLDALLTPATGEAVREGIHSTAVATTGRDSTGQRR